MKIDPGLDSILSYLRAVRFLNKSVIKELPKYMSLTFGICFIWEIGDIDE